MNKLQICIIKSFVTYYLMKESNQLDSIIFIWLWQINVFKIYDQFLTLLWSINSSESTWTLLTHLIEFLKNVECRCLSITVNDRNLTRLHLICNTFDDKRFTTSLWSYKDKRFVWFEIRLNHVGVSLTWHCLNHWRIRSVFHVFKHQVLSFRIVYKSSDPWVFLVIVVVKNILRVCWALVCCLVNEVS